MDNDVFVKLNFKNIGELRSLIVDRKDIGSYYKGKYIMCAGKHDKDGWTIVFKARDYEEAQYIINNTSVNKAKENRIEETPLDISILQKATIKKEEKRFKRMVS